MDAWSAEAAQGRQESEAAWKQVAQARAVAARLLGCKPEEISLLGPTALGLGHQFSLTCADVFARDPARTRHRMLPQNLVLLAQLPGGVDDAALAQMLREVMALLLPNGSFLLGWIELPPAVSLLHEHLLGATVPTCDLARVRALGRLRGCAASGRRAS